MDDAQRGKRDGILQAADQSRGGARQSGRDLTGAAPIIVTATFAAADDAWLQDLRRAHFPPARNQVPAHLTLFHHLAPDLERELSQRLSGYTAVAAPPATVTGILDLGGGTALRIDSEGLADIRADLADAFRGLLIPQDQAPWRPHVTIQNKVEPKAAKALQQVLRAGFERRPLGLRGLHSWRYLGGPWEPIKHHRFRG